MLSLLGLLIPPLFRLSINEFAECCIVTDKENTKCKEGTEKYNIYYSITL